MTTLLIIIGVLLLWGYAVMKIAGLNPRFVCETIEIEPTYTRSECIEFAQSVTNIEVTVYDFEQWLSHEGRKIRFSDN